MIHPTITVIYLSLIVFCLYMLVRNRLVFNLRNRVNHEIYNSNKPHKEIMKMYELYSTVSYQEMMWRILTSPKKIEKEFRETIGLKED